MIFHAVDPLSGPAFDGDDENPWLYSDEYTLSFPEKKSPNDRVKRGELCHFFCQRTGSIT